MHVVVVVVVGGGGGGGGVCVCKRELEIENFNTQFGPNSRKCAYCVSALN